MYGAGAGAAWSRLFLPGAGADPSRSEPEPESAPGPWRPGAGAGAAQKSGGSATLLRSRTILLNVEWLTPPLRRSGPRKRTRELGELSGEGAEPGENFSVVVLTLTLIAEELTPCSVKALAQAFNKKARVRNP